MEAPVFLFFAALAVAGAGIVLFHRSVVHAAFGLMGALFGVAGLYLLLGADFLAVVQLMIYVGGILVLLLFGVMLTPDDKAEFSRMRVGGTLFVVGGGALLLGLRAAGAESWAMAEGDLAEPVTRIREIGLAFLSRGHSLVAFELAAVLLTAALVGAVMIARRRVEAQDESTAEHVRETSGGGN